MECYPNSLRIEPSRGLDIGVMCVWPSRDTIDPKCQILALLPNSMFVTPKERNTLFFSVFSEGQIQPRAKGITQVEVKK